MVGRIWSKSIFYLLITIISLKANAQNSYVSTSCGTYKDLSLEKRTELAALFSSWQTVKKKQVSKNVSLKNISLVFHVMRNETPSIPTFRAAIAKLNAAFSNTGSFATAAGLDTHIRFCLSNTAPDGGSTSGVQHLPSSYKEVDMDLEHADLTNLNKWNTAQYLNVWLVNDIRGEALADYDGPTWWKRLGIAGYATADGIVVTSLDPELLAHEIGHYFGLLHTWSGRNCKNDDCTLDGDMICDTPPDKSVGACADNSCQTDTLSNFSNNNFLSDTLDMSTNFMDYSPCRTDFTRGQVDRMHFTLETNFPTLFEVENENTICDSPCGDTASISFTVDQQYPIPKKNVAFKSLKNTNWTSVNYKWYVLAKQANSWMASTELPAEVATTADLDFIFPKSGDYQVILHAFSASDSSCFVSFSKFIRVSCGVDARFSPDKRLIASKQPHALMTDSVTFTNYSYNATAYEWQISHRNFDDTSPNLPVFSTIEENLTYFFKEPGIYSISLKAINGNCEDLSEIFSLTVYDPTMDAVPKIQSISCLLQNQVLIDYSIQNLGYDTINDGTPLALYDRNPQQSAEAQLLASWKLPEIVYGFEEKSFSIQIEEGLEHPREVFLVFNVTDSTQLPLQFPPDDKNILSIHSVFPHSGYAELSYSNNISSYEILDIQEQAVDTLVCLNQVIHLELYQIFEPEICLDSVVWTSKNMGYLGSTESINYSVLQNDTIFVTYGDSKERNILGYLNVRVNYISSAVEDTVFRITKGDAVQFKLSGASSYTYEWSPPDGLSNTTIASPSAAPNEDTRYTVKITDAIGCMTTKHVMVWVETSAHIPKLFTPNNDGSNDRLLLYGLNNVKEIEFQVFNQFGQLVFSNNNANNLTSVGWDGSYNGNDMPSAVYYWAVSGLYEDGRSIELSGQKRGEIHLMR